MINEKLTGIDCPRYSKVEIWDYAIECKAARQMQREFVVNATRELLRCE